MGGGEPFSIEPAVAERPDGLDSASAQSCSTEIILLVWVIR